MAGCAGGRDRCLPQLLEIAVDAMGQDNVLCDCFTHQMHLKRQMFPFRYSCNVPWFSSLERAWCSSIGSAGKGNGEEGFEKTPSNALLRHISRMLKESLTSSLSFPCCCL